MERVGEVTAVRGDELQITFCRPADCGKCHACIGGKPQTTLVLKGQAHVGDAAVVDMPASTVVKASAIAYIIPLAGLLLGAVLGHQAQGDDMGTALGGLIGLALAGGIVLLGEKKRRAQTQWQPVLKQVLPGGAAAVKEE